MNKPETQPEPLPPAPGSALPPLTLEEAGACAKQTDYAHDAIEAEGQCECGRKIINAINWADAAAFFLEGYERARRLETRNLNKCVEALEFIAFNNHPCWNDRDRRYRALQTLQAIGTHVRLTPNAQGQPPPAPSSP